MNAEDAECHGAENHQAGKQNEFPRLALDKLEISDENDQQITDSRSH